MMSTTTFEQTTTPRGLDARVLNEGYRPGAWHGPDLKAALADVTPSASARARSAVGNAAGVVRAGRRGLVRVA
jgi:hypothetical protein